MLWSNCVTMPMLNTQPRGVRVTLKLIWWTPPLMGHNNNKTHKINRDHPRSISGQAL